MASNNKLPDQTIAPSSACLRDKELQPGESCKLWVHAIADTAHLGSQAQTLTISVQNGAAGMNNVVRALLIAPSIQSVQ